MKKVYYFFSLLSLSMILVSHTTVSEIGRAGSTGAPGESTCASCHGGALGGSAKLTSDIPLSGFVPGATYNMTLTVSQAGQPLFGMGLEALNTASTTNAGNLTAGNGTQILMKGTRQNVTHTFGGGATSLGSKAFTFTWTAPAVAGPTVTFYYAGLAANGNGVEDAGDNTYSGFEIFSPQTAVASVLTMNCPTDVVVTAAAGATTAVANYTAPTGTSTCTTGTITTTKTSGLASGSAFPVGTNAVCYTATDGCGNTKNCCFNVIVNSAGSGTSVLTLNCPTDITLTAASGATTAAANYTAPTASSTCTTGVVSTTKSSGLASGTAFPIGTNAVCYTATDGCGNTKNCCFNVIVNAAASTILTINCPIDIVVTAATGATTAVASYTAPTASSTCTTGSILTTKTSGLASGSAFPVGTSAVCYTATDGCGNTKNCCFNVTVRAAVAATLTLNCANSVTVTAATGATSASVSYGSPTGSSTCTSGSVSVIKTSGLATGSAFPIGTSSVCFTATDGCSNTKNCCLTVTVNAATTGGGGGGDHDGNEGGGGSGDDKNKDKNKEKGHHLIVQTTSTLVSNQIREMYEVDANPDAQQVSMLNTISQKTFGMYPNPANNFVNVNVAAFKGQAVRVQILNQVGKAVLTTTVQEASGFITLPLDNVVDGFYYITLFSNGVIKSNKLIVSKTN
jgi:HYR domain/Secretion system C-terminal sorting domain